MNSLVPKRPRLVITDDDEVTLSEDLQGIRSQNSAVPSAQPVVDRAQPASEAVSQTAADAGNSVLEKQNERVPPTALAAQASDPPLASRIQLLEETLQESKLQQQQTYEMLSRLTAMVTSSPNKDSSSSLASGSSPSPSLATSSLSPGTTNSVPTRLDPKLDPKQLSSYMLVAPKAKITMDSAATVIKREWDKFFSEFGIDPSSPVSIAVFRRKCAEEVEAAIGMAQSYNQAIELFSNYQICNASFEEALAWSQQGHPLTEYLMKKLQKLETAFRANPSSGVLGGSDPDLQQLNLTQAISSLINGMDKRFQRSALHLKDNAEGKYKTLRELVQILVKRANANSFLLDSEGPPPLVPQGAVGVVQPAEPSVVNPATQDFVPNKHVIAGFQHRHVFWCNHCGAHGDHSGRNCRLASVVNPQTPPDYRSNRGNGRGGSANRGSQRGNPNRPNRGRSTGRRGGSVTGLPLNVWRDIAQRTVNAAVQAANNHPHADEFVDVESVDDVDNSNTASFKNYVSQTLYFLFSIFSIISDLASPWNFDCKDYVYSVSDNGAPMAELRFGSRLGVRVWVRV